MPDCPALYFHFRKLPAVRSSKQQCGVNDLLFKAKANKLPCGQHSLVMM